MLLRYREILWVTSSGACRKKALKSCFWRSLSREGNYYPILQHRMLCSKKQGNVDSLEIQDRKVAFPEVWDVSVNHEFSGFDSLLPFILFFLGKKFALYEKLESWKVAWRLEEDTAGSLGEMHF